MKITILAEKNGYTGIDKATCSIANMLSYQNQVKVVNVYKEMNTHLLNQNIEIKYLMENENIENNNSFFKKIIFNIKKKLLQKIMIKKELENNDSDIFLTTNMLYLKWLGTYKKDNKFKIFIENEYFINDEKYLKKLKKCTKNINYILTVSKEIRDHYKEKLNIKCYYMPNVLDNIPEISTDFSKNNLITVGKLSEEKAIGDLIDVFYQLHLEYPELTLDIVGDGPELIKIKKKIFDLRIKDLVTLHGYQNKEYINNLLANSSIFVLTSKKESFGLALLEGMSYGLPSVVFDSAKGVLEFVENNVNGYIIPNRNIEEMTRKIKLLVANDDFKRQIGIKAKETAKNYSFNNIMNRWNEFINSIVNDLPFDERKEIEEIDTNVYKKNDIQSLLAQIADKDNQPQDTSNLID